MLLHFTTTSYYILLLHFITKLLAAAVRRNLVLHSTRTYYCVLLQVGRSLVLHYTIAYYFILLQVRRTAVASLSLDTPLYNSMTTGCDVLWSGVPLVSYAGERMLTDADGC